MLNPKITVITSAYNSENFVAITLESVLNQTFKDFEYIIFEDASSDNTAKILKEYSQKDSRIKIVTKEKNLGYQGFIKNLNSGLKMARGKYIARIDADDIANADRLQVQYDFLEKNKDIFLVASSYDLIDESGSKLSSEIFNMDNDEIVSKFPNKCFINHPTVMFRNKGNIFYREKALYCEDRDLWFRMALEQKPMRIIPDNLVQYRLHKKSESNSKRNMQNSFIKQVNRWYLEKKNNGVDTYEDFDPDTILSKKQKGLENQEYVRAREIKIHFKENQNNNIIRQDIKSYWRAYGFYTWKTSWCYFLVTFSPKFVQQMSRKMIWRNK